MRFFFNSPRYSEDIDLDVEATRIDVLRTNVVSILKSKALGDALQIRGIEIERISEPKQTETTQLHIPAMIGRRSGDR